MSEGKRIQFQLGAIVRSAIVVLLLFLAFHYGIAITHGGIYDADQVVIAHRGGPEYQPENTLAAFKQAIEDGVDWIEFDVQMTRDGVLVVFHDVTVERTTNGNGSVGDLTFDQIRALDAGNEQKVPTFEEVILLAKSHGVGILPEAKSPALYPGIEVKMVDALVRLEYLDNTIVQSFDVESLEKMSSINPDLKLCPLYGLGVVRAPEDLVDNADHICPMAEMVFINPGIIRSAHADSRQVFIWFGAVENPIMMRVLLAFGADGLMVDDQLQMINALGGK